MRGSCESWRAIEVFRTARTNNLNARSALSLSPLTRPELKDQRSVTTCHTSSQSVTLCHNCDTRPVTTKLFRSSAELKPSYVDQAELAAWYDKCRAAVAPES